MGLSIKVTSECEKLCSWCPVLPWMDANPGYHLAMAAIEDLIKYSKSACYHWNFIMFSGGEPMRWRNIVAAAKLLKRSHITDQIITYTNAMTDIEKVKEVSRYVDTIKVSAYDYNKPQVSKLLSEVKNATRITRLYFKKIADERIPDSLPADCTCSAYGMIGNRITLCSFMEFMIAYKGWDIKDFEDEVSILGPNFLDKLKKKDPFAREMCAYCFGNSKVDSQVEKIPNKAFI
jgi:hypothetical protein